MTFGNPAFYHICHIARPLATFQCDPKILKMTVHFNFTSDVLQYQFLNTSYRTVANVINIRYASNIGPWKCTHKTA
jgi:hypothetical protein